jgi:hypothetical protein
MLQAQHLQRSLDLFNQKNNSLIGHATMPTLVNEINRTNFSLAQGSNST